ncbi:hypothetical protein G8A07_04490 [Roseateles sp. DAIF2]|uniref:hypothetical protein n=1 Tax=Roseateles sp. DAIF2 TaxID=2714952 RepID=UPI0018A2EFC5|nr:hypothetical protein [Roseateles sp. DAIF2]QPF71454.1 hypothetical protein G8A07_04490 [Roseateles sp. DAIF2]
MSRISISRSRIAATAVLLNDHPFKRLPGCRRDRFEMQGRPTLKPLAIGTDTQVVGISRSRRCCQTVVAMIKTHRNGGS